MSNLKSKSANHELRISRLSSDESHTHVALDIVVNDRIMDLKDPLPLQFFDLIRDRRHISKEGKMIISKVFPSDPPETHVSFKIRPIWTRSSQVQKWAR